MPPKDANEGNKGGNRGGGRKDNKKSDASPAKTRSHTQTPGGDKGKVSAGSKGTSTTPTGRRLEAEKAAKQNADAAAAATARQSPDNTGAGANTPSSATNQQGTHQTPNAGVAPSGATSSPTAAGGSSGGIGGQPGASPAQNNSSRGMYGGDGDVVHDQYIDEESSMYLSRGKQRTHDGDLNDPPKCLSDIVLELTTMRSDVDSLDKDEHPTGHGWEAHIVTDMHFGPCFITMNWTVPSFRRYDIVEVFVEMRNNVMEATEYTRYAVEAHRLASLCSAVISQIAIEARQTQAAYRCSPDFSTVPGEDAVPDMMNEDTPNARYYLDIADCLVSMMIALEAAGELEKHYHEGHPDFDASKDNEEEAREDRSPLGFLGSQISGNNNNRASRRAPRSGNGGGGGGGDDEPGDGGDNGGGNNGFPRSGRRNERNERSTGGDTDRFPQAWFGNMEKVHLLKGIDAAKNEITNPKNTVTSQDISSIVKTLVKGEFKATDSFISEWSKAMTKIALGDKLKPGLSMELLVGVMPFAASFTKLFRFSKALEFLTQHSYVETTPSDNQGTETISNYFARASTSINHHVNGTHQGTLLQSQAPPTGRFDVTEKRLVTFNARVDELGALLQERGFGLTPSTLPSTHDILDDTENAEIVFDFMIFYHEKVQSRLITFMHDFMTEVCKKNKSSTFQKILNEAKSSVNAILVADKNSVVPRASYHEFLDIVLKRDQTGIYLVQEFLYDLATPDMGNVCNAATTFLESPTLVNPGWSLLDLEIFLTEKIKQYQEHLPHESDEGVQYLETVVVVACVEKLVSSSGSRWPKGAELSSFVREATFERNRPACREELGRHYKLLVGHIADQAVTHDFPEDPKVKSSWKPPTKTKSRKTGGQANASINATIGAEKAKEIKDMQERVKDAVNDSGKLQTAINKSIERRKKNHNAAFSFAKSKLLSNNKLKTVFEPLFETMTNADKPRKKLKIAEAMKIPEATIKKMDADQLQAFMILNPSFGAPGNVGGKVLQTKGNGEVEEEEEEDDGDKKEIKAMLTTALDRMNSLQTRLDSAEASNSSNNGPADQTQQEDDIKSLKAEMVELKDEILSIKNQM